MIANCISLQKLTLSLSLAGALAMYGTAVLATEMVYSPVNPSFGGNPTNGIVELNQANATNKHKDPASSVGTNAFAQKTPLQTFNDSLERAVLGQLASSASQKLLGGVNGTLSPGVVDTANFTIRITDLGGGALQVTTTDKTTGISTSFQVGQ